MFRNVGRHFLHTTKLREITKAVHVQKIIPSELAIRRSEAEVTVRDLIESKVRPHAQSDGGDVQFLSMDHENGIVHVAMKGACVSCSSSSVTLKFMVLRLLKFYVPEVLDVEGHDDDSSSPNSCG